MDFKDFEGVKRIKNTKKLIAEEVVDLLDEYKKVLGEITYEVGLDDADIVVNFPGKYNAIVRIDEDREEIMIEKRLDEGYMESDDDSNDSQVKIDNTEGDNFFPNDVKSVTESIADQTIDQMYDLILDFMDDGVITEHITGSQKTLYLDEEQKIILNGIYSTGNVFIATDDTNKKIYEVSENKLVRTYTVSNLVTKRNEATIEYSKYKDKEYTIALQSLERIVLKIDSQSTVKTKFKGKSSKRELEITADYTDNHFLVEENKIVIGSIHCLNPLMKSQYKIEIHDLEKESLLVSIAGVIDTYLRKEEDIRYKKELIEDLKHGKIIKNKN